MSSQFVLQLVDLALISLHNDREGHLRLPLRHHILASLGSSRQTGMFADITVGVARRARLAIASVECILPKWNAIFPNDDSPQRLLTLAHDALKHDRNVQTIVSQKHLLKEHLQELPFDQFPDRLELLVGDTALRALHVALFDEQLQPWDDETLTEADIDDSLWDTSYFASSIASGGWSVTGIGDVVLRRQYWEWYLTQAIPHVLATTDGDTE